MNNSRLTSLAAAFAITASQWALCLALFFYSQPVNAVGSQFVNDSSQANMPEIVVIGHRL